MRLIFRNLPNFAHIVVFSYNTFAKQIGFATITGLLVDI